MVRLRTYSSEIKSQCNIIGIGVGSWSREGTSIAKKREMPKSYIFGNYDVINDQLLQIRNLHTFALFRYMCHWQSNIKGRGYQEAEKVTCDSHG